VTVDPSVIAALEAAVEGDPGNAPLAAHLASLLLEAGRPQEALERCQAALALTPADPALLETAARAARAAQPLTSVGPPPEASPEPPPAAGEGAEVVPLRLVPGGRAEYADGLERPQVTLADVGGLENVKRRLQSSFLGPLQNPQLRAAYGKSLRGGLLLYGPPGCGKTFIARAVAGELGARFTSIGISDVLDMYIGESERKLHELFQTARRGAPCVVFLDEVDALGQKRSHLRHSGTRSSVNQLLTELDSVSSDNEGVFVLAATNHPWDVDTALRRPGRLDRMLLVLPPDAPAREVILRLHLRDRPVADDLDLASIVKSTVGFSGADLAHLCELATEAAMEASMDSGNVEPITTGRLVAARRELDPSTRAWFDVAYNYAMFANEGGLYDELLAYVKEHKLR
jgi:SpoVK/Ycf46/Vps4 family AAA+-type ATPase